MQYRTTILQPLKSYPTYQFHAFTASEKHNVNDVFKICILETFKWLRARLKKFPELPKEILTPEPDEYESFSENELYSFSYSSSVNINVVYIAKKGIWSFSISENDSGANHGKENERLPVTGRVFNTEISFVKHKKSVEVGVRTICSEPSDCTADCEVFRPMLIRSLSHNPEVGFSYMGFKIVSNPFIIKSNSDVDNFGKLYNNPQFDMPVIFIAEAGYEESKKPPEFSLPSIKPELPINTRLFKESEETAEFNIDMSKVDIEIKDSFRNLKAKKELELNKSAGKEEKRNNIAPVPLGITEKNKLTDFPYKKLAASLMGFAVVCFVETKYFRLVKNKYGINIDNGDIIVCSRAEELERHYYSQYIKNIDEFYSSFRSQMQMMPKRSQYTFGDALFYSDAKLIELKEKRHETDSLSERCEILHQENAELKKQLTEFSHQNTDMKLNTEKLRQVQKKLDTAEKEIAGKDIYYKKIAEEYRKREETYKKAAELIAFYRQKADIAAGFPTDRNDVCDWIEKNFADGIVITPRAKTELKKYDGSLDIGILCDGILYLYAYSRFRKGIISEKELELYAERRGWIAETCGKATLKARHDDYIATYNGEKYLLDMHIKYGVNGQFLIRIYFYWSDRLKKVIIGYMPGHLPTIKQTT